MSDFWTLTNKDKVMDYLDSELDMTDYGYSVVKQDATAITDVINQVWQDEVECFLENCWRDVKTNILEELTSQGYLTRD